MKIYIDFDFEKNLFSCAIFWIRIQFMDLAALQDEARKIQVHHNETKMDMLSKKFNRKQFLRGGKVIDKNIKGTDYDNLDMLPADFSYRNLDVALVDLKRSRRKLKEIFRPYRDEYEYIFFDCPPNITLMSENIFYAADILVVPCIPTTLSMLTFEKLVSFFKNKGLNRNKIKTFFSMVEKRKKLHRDIIADPPAKKKNVFLNSLIPYQADIERMGLTREPIVCSKPRSKAAKAYEKLWQEIKQNSKPT